MIRTCWVSLAALAAISDVLYAAPAIVDPSLRVVPVVQTGTISFPTCMSFVGAREVLVGEKFSGRVLHVVDGAVNPVPVLDLPVNSSAERGLLGMVLDPQFSLNKLVYLYYTRAAVDGGAAIDHRISRFTWTGAALINEQALVTLPAGPSDIHDGGTLAFGPPTAPPAQQKLFAVVGDLDRKGRNQNYAGAAAPDDSGSIIRVNADGSTPGGAEGGPFALVAGLNSSLRRQYAYGIRNSFGLDFDPVTGALWDTENGAGAYDEINRVDPGFNSGWERIMGPSSAPNSVAGGQGLADLVNLLPFSTYSEPEFSWFLPVAPTALHFMRSAALGQSYQYDCFVGGMKKSRIYRFQPNLQRSGFDLPAALADTIMNDGVDDDSSIVFGTGFSIVTDIETGLDGLLYVLTMGDGQIYRIDVAPTAAENWAIYE